MVSQKVNTKVAENAETPKNYLRIFLRYDRILTIAVLSQEIAGKAKVLFTNNTFRQKCSLQRAFLPEI